MKRELLGVRFDAVTMDSAVACALSLAEGRSGAYVCTPNPEIVMLARRDPALMEAINSASLVLPDGAGVVWAAKKLGKPVPERVAGYDFMLALLERLDGGVLIYGGRPGVAEAAAASVAARYPNVTVCGAFDGYGDHEAEVLAAIRKTRPAFVMVCLGARRQELWMAAHTDLPVGLMAGLGGSVDILAGSAKRAPLRWRRHGLEWLYRLIREPRRIRRQLRLPAFVLAVLREKRGP